MAMRCGHVEACMYRFRHKGISYKYCMPCLINKVGLKQVTEEQTTIAEDLGIGVKTVSETVAPKKTKKQVKK